MVVRAVILGVYAPCLQWTQLSSDVRSVFINNKKIECCSQPYVCVQHAHACLSNRIFAWITVLTCPRGGRRARRSLFAHLARLTRVGTKRFLWSRLRGSAREESAAHFLTPYCIKFFYEYVYAVECAIKNEHPRNRLNEGEKRAQGSRNSFFHHMNVSCMQDEYNF